MIFPSLAVAFLLQSGIWFALLCAVVGLGAAGYLIRKIISSSPGNARMRQIAAAIEEGAKAYLNRQIRTISAIALVIAGILVPSFTPGATQRDENLVLWDWSERPPHQVKVFDPSGRLPRDQRSWE